MANTLEVALRSVLDQLDERFELVLVDDGSSDSSVEIIKALEKEYPVLRLVALQRSRQRKLGFTRNISVEEAKGEYVLLQLDCDDEYGPHVIPDFVNIFHQLEACVGRDFYLKGRKINMGRKEFLMQFGPYRNMARASDIDLWKRLAAVDAYIKLDHPPIMRRLPKTRKQRATRAMNHTWHILNNRFRYNPSLLFNLLRNIEKWSKESLTLNIYKLIMLLPAYVAAKFQEPLVLPANMNAGKKFGVYRSQHRGSFKELMKRYEGEADCSVLSEKGKEIFC